MGAAKNAVKMETGCPKANKVPKAANEPLNTMNLMTVLRAMFGLRSIVMRINATIEKGKT